MECDLNSTQMCVNVAWEDKNIQFPIVTPKVMIWKGKYKNVMNFHPNDNH
jgi:hypothetical protein